MKILENLILKACGYTASILFLFYLAGTLTDFTKPYIDFKTFLFVALFGVMIALAGLILNIQRIRAWVRVLIHYSVLFCAFTVIFVSSGNISSRGSAAIFSSLIIFTVLYAILFSAIYFIRKYVKKADSRLDSKIKTSQKKAKKSEYKSLYKGD